MISKVKKLITSIRKQLIKKVFVQEVYFRENILILELELINFLVIRDIKCEVEIDEHTQSINYSKEKNRLKIIIPINSITDVHDKAKLKIYINNQLMWIRKAKDLSVASLGFIIKQKYYELSIRKKVINIKPVMKEYQFHSSSIEVEKVVTDFNRLKFTTDKNRPLLSDSNSVNIIGVRNHKIRILDVYIDYESNEIEILNLNVLSIGVWNLYVDKNFNLYPLELVENNKHSLDTMNHHITIESSQKHMILDLKPHVIKTKEIEIEHSGNNIELKMVLEPLNDFKNDMQIIVEDIKYNQEKYYKLKEQDGRVITSIPFIDLVERTSTKRFFVVGYQREKGLGEKYQLDITEELRIDSSKRIKTVINSQETTFQFYVRKDSSLGLLVRLPKLRRLITEIENFKLYGFIQGMNKFVDCTPYLILQDRYTEEMVEYEISNSFTVELNHTSLMLLKGKDKSILDFFVAIKDKYGNYIRKVKIKYEQSDYKKDNYYDELQIKDTQGDIHYFIATTTPYDNLKLETFKVPAKIVTSNLGKYKDDKIWLLGERYDTAQDNGFVLFDWLNKHTDIDAYYVIEEDSEDYQKIKDNPKVIPFGSDRHYEIALKAKVLLGTHDLENLLPYKAAPGFFHYEETIKIFLQHGVLGRKKVEYHKQYYESPFDLFIVSSYPEKYDIVVKQFGYDEEEVKVTGLARFDNLKQNEKGQDILLMPTWRDWINTDEQFLKSEYFHNYVRFLKNKELHRLLEQFDVKLNFYPHYRAQEFFKKELENTGERINFITLGTKSVQELLKQHALLITDYSSVSFDFTLMEKPVIFYHFDERRFFRNGILRPIEETFLGRIAKSEQELIEFISERMQQNFDNYKIDIAGIIQYMDNNNCRRIYQEVIAYMEQGRSTTIEELNNI